MRTTLKRGIGRGAGANGNGRAVLPPAFQLPRTHTRYRQPPRERSVAGVIAAVLGWLLVSIVTVAVGLAGGLYLYYHQSVRDITAHTPELRIAQERLDLPLPDAAATALVVGVDERLKGVDATDGSPPRSDTLLLMRADPKQRALSLLSFPRDLLVPIVCPDRPTFTGRINEAFSTCGTQGALETVRNLTGLPINYLVTVNFVGFVQMVAKLGGVWMDVDRRYYNPPGTGFAEIDLHPGYQRLNGRQALSFVRFRHTDSDIYRLARQQLFVHAFKQAVTSSLSPLNVPKIVGVARENLEIGAKGGEIDGRTVLQWGLFAFDLPAGNVFQTKIDISCYGETATFAVTASQECIDEAVAEFSRPDVEAPEKATNAALGRRPRTDAPRPADTTVVVLNGNGVPGAAADASYQLSQQGYATQEPANGAAANAPTQDFLRTQIYFDDALPEARRAAARLVTVFGGQTDADTAAMPVSIQPLTGDAMVAVVLGRNFGGNIDAPVDQTPQRTPPAVVRNPDATLAALREAQKQLRFPLQVPTMIEQTSRLSSQEGARVYKMAGHPTVRLTFVTGASEYWGIQMVRWRQAPALRGANKTVTMKGRTYDLYYSGSKLQLVVLRDQGTTYWVTNTLLGRLSNETMLAIARGLRPLKGR
jgi:LCP family protein required for cell wall assembly